MELGEIHLWTANLDLGDSELEAFRRTLSPDEIERADRFLRDADRRRFTASRGILRTLLGQYLGKRAGEIRFSYGEKGKPLLAEGGIHFNLSHCEDRALFALARERELGVDLQIPRPGLDVTGLASRFFSTAEAEQLAKLPAEEKERLFYRWWTAKEAYAKALGEGLNLLQREPGSDDRFRIEYLALKEEGVGALAYSGDPAKLVQQIF